MSEPDQRLRALGIGAAEEAGYELLLAHPGLTQEDLATRWRRPEPLPDVLAALVTVHQLVTRLPGDPSRYVAADPDAALRTLLSVKERTLDLARAYADGLTAKYRPAAENPAVETVVEVVTEPSAVVQRCADLYSLARREIRHLVRCSGSGPLPAYLTALTGRPAATVGHRVIYERGHLDCPGVLDEAERLIRSGAQARVLPSLTSGWCLVDNRLALLGNARTLVVVHPSTILSGLAAQFEQLWQRALPLYTPAAQDRQKPTTTNQELVALLLSGLTDDGIARQLGVGHRTVQRRVAELIRELGVQTRFQAGVQAALRYPPESTENTDPR